MPSRSAASRVARATLILRALFAAVAAMVVTFAQERTGIFSVAVFAAFAIATGVVFAVDAALTRTSAVAKGALAAVHVIAGALSILLPLAPAHRFHAVLLGWAVVAGVIELAVGIARRRDGSAWARDAITVGALTLLLAAVTLVVSPDYALDYFVEEARQEFTLTGTIIGVGLFGGWAAIVAVYLGIGAVSPAPKTASLTKDPA